MVCSDEGSTQCIIVNLMPDAKIKKLTLLVRPSYTVKKLFEDIQRQFDVINFNILIQTSKNSEEIRITESMNKKLSDIGIDFELQQNRTTIKLVPELDNIDNNMTQDGEIETFTVKQRRSAIVDTSEADSTVTNPLDDYDNAYGNSSSPIAATADDNTSPIPLPLFSDGPSYSSKTYYPSRCKYFVLRGIYIVYIFYFFIRIYSINTIIMRLCWPCKSSNDLLFKQFITNIIHDT